MMCFSVRTACGADPEIRPALARGDFKPLVGWLRTHVHSQGSLLETDDLLAAATGRPMDSGPFLDHLRQRYLAAPAT